MITEYLSSKPSKQKSKNHFRCSERKHDNQLFQHQQIGLPLHSGQALQPIRPVQALDREIVKMALSNPQSAPKSVRNRVTGQGGAGLQGDAPPPVHEPPASLRSSRHRQNQHCFGLRQGALRRTPLQKAHFRIECFG